MSTPTSLPPASTPPSTTAVGAADIAAATLGAGAAPAPARRAVSRRTARNIAVVRDVLASIKDAGLIALVVGLVVFHDEVGGMLADLDIVRGGDERTVDVGRALARLNKALDTAPLPAPAASGAAAAPVSWSAKVLRAERRLLRSEDAAFIDDWIVVVAPFADAAQAEAAATQLAAVSVTAGVVHKGGRWRVVAAAGSAEAVQSVLNRVRLRHPRALPTTVSSWCPLPAPSTSGMAGGAGAVGASGAPAATIPAVCRRA